MPFCVLPLALLLSWLVLCFSCFIVLSFHYLVIGLCLFLEYPSTDQTVFGIHDFLHVDGTLDNGCDDFAGVTLDLDPNP